MVKSLPGSTLREARAVDAWRSRGRRDTRRPGLVQRLASEENSRRANVVAHVDQEQSKIAAPPQESGEHHQSAHLTQQRGNRGGSLSDEAGDDLRHEEQQQE